MAEESLIPSPPPPADEDDFPPPRLQPVAIAEKEEPAPEPSSVEARSLAAMMEKEVSSPTAAVEKEKKEEVVDAEKEKPNVPRSLVSFKEESNVVADLSDSERKSLLELKQLVQKALNNHQFTQPPPPPKQEEKQKSTRDIPKPEGPATDSDVSIQLDLPQEESQAVAKEEPQESNVEETPKKELLEVAKENPQEKKLVEEVATEEAQESKVEENPQKELHEVAEEEPKIPVQAEEVSIWGVPLLKDDRSDVILLKFLRARDFKVMDAFLMIKNTIQWRKEFGINALVDEDLGDDLEKVVFMHGYDREGHPVCYNVYGEFQNKELYRKTFLDEEKRMRFLRWRIQYLERSIRKLDFRPGGIGTIFQVNDLKNSPGPGKRELRLATKHALQLLQDNYPEFVAKQVFINVPWWYLAFYTMMSPFMTQRTKSKFVFAGPSKSAETLFKYVSPEQVPIQYGGLSVDYCDCNPEFTIADPVTDITVKPATKQTVEIIIYEKCIIVWEIRVVGWEVNYGAEFVPDNKDGYTIIIQKPTKMSPTDEPVVCTRFKVGELGKVLFTIDNPTSKKKKFLYRFKIEPFYD